jgi:hypothetical protein
VKCELADKNTKFRLSDIAILMNAALDNITKAVCEPCVKHKKNIQEKYFRSKQLPDIFIHLVRAKLQDNSSSSETKMVVFWVVVPCRLV